MAGSSVSGGHSSQVQLSSTKDSQIPTHLIFLESPCKTWLRRCPVNTRAFCSFNLWFTFLPLCQCRVYISHFKLLSNVRDFKE